MAYLLAVGLAILVFAMVVGPWATITIFEYERALRFVNGKCVALVGPGKYWYLTRRTHYQRVDTRLRSETVSGQEVLSSDGVAFKASLLASYRITDPRSAVLETNDLSEAIHASLQLALRGIVATHDSEQLLQRRADFSAALLALAAPPLTRLGVELQSVGLRDLTLPGELKKVFSQVVQARQEGLASLERARGESAALRSLANSAQLIERHPHLLQLRLLQAIGEGSGHTIVLGNPPLGLPHSPGATTNVTASPEPDA